MLNTIMENIHTISNETVQKACAIWERGGLVAIPTETVYGVGADSTNANAVINIYTAKGRPSFNPLISHVSDMKMLKKIAIITPMAQTLIDKFFPGSLTLVLKRSTDCPVASIACAGLDTIAVRMPAHTFTRNLIATYGKPIVAPSANKSGHISPTTAHHVSNSLGGAIDMIIDGGKCDCGLESTIVDVSTDIPYLLRAGTISKEVLVSTLEQPLTELTFAKGNNPIAPGQLKAHYAPDMPLYMNISTPNPKHAYLGFGDCGDCTLNLSQNGNLAEAGKNLFDYLHKLNNNGVLAIDVAPIPNIGIGIAINDKLLRASTNKLK